jgi:hypothetical protein
MSNILICMALKTRDNFTLLSLNPQKWEFVGSHFEYARLNSRTLWQQQRLQRVAGGFSYRYYSSFRNDVPYYKIFKNYLKGCK